MENRGKGSSSLLSDEMVRSLARITRCSQRTWDRISHVRDLLNGFSDAIYIKADLNLDADLLGGNFVAIRNPLNVNYKNLSMKGRDRTTTTGIPTRKLRTIEARLTVVPRLAASRLIDLMCVRDINCKLQWYIYVWDKYIYDIETGAAKQHTREDVLYFPFTNGN